MNNYTLTKKLEARYSADVVVCGGGTAGAFAAIAAAERGCKVMIVEQFGGLGGTATYGLVTPVMHTHISSDPQCSYIVPKLNALMVRLGVADPATGRYFDPMGLKIALERMCMDAGVEMLFHTFITDVIKEGDTVKGIVVSNKSGTYVVEGKVFIDCTGDGDVSVLAGAEYTKGNPETGKCQPISLRYLVDGVNVPEMGEFLLSETARTGVDSACSYNRDTQDFYMAVCREGAWTLGDLFDKAIAAGDLVPEDRWYWQAFRVPGRPSTVAFNNPEFFEEVDGTDVEHLTHTQLVGKQRIMRQLMFYKKYFKGFENAYIGEIAGMVGIRESRNIVTKYVMTAEDLMKKNKFDDAFCQSNYPIDIHGKTLNCKPVAPNDDGKPWYEIPYGTLVVRGIDNLMVAGRCLGCEFLAQSSLRVQQSVRSSGEAAGIGAAMAVEQSVLPKQIDGRAVRTEMEKLGAVYVK